MARTTTSVTIHPNVLKRIDAFAARHELNRSEALTVLAERALNNPDAPVDYWEFLRLTGYPSQLREVFKSGRMAEFLQHDDDGQVEVVLRCTVKQYHAWMNKPRLTTEHDTKGGE